MQKTKIAGIILVVLLFSGVGLFWWNHSSAERVQDKMDLAVKYITGNNYEKAILAYNDAIKIDPRAGDAYMGLAKVYTLLGNYNEAQSVYQKGIEQVESEEKQNLQLGLAGMYIDKGKMTEAEQSFQKIINNNPSCLEAYWGLAMVYQQQGNNSKAEEFLKLAIEVNPNEYRGYNTLALFFSQNGERDKAFDLLVKSLSLEFNQQEAYLVLKDIYKSDWSQLSAKAENVTNPNISAMLKFYSCYADEDYQSAVKIFDNSLSNQKDNHKAHILAAIAMVKSGNTDRGQDQIAQLAKIQPGGWLFSDIAEFYLAAGDKDKARIAAINALEANSTNLDAVSILQRINCNDEDAQKYAAEFLLYNWKPVAAVKEILTDSKIIVAFDIHSTKAKQDKTTNSSDAAQENKDPKLALLQAVAAYCNQNLPYFKNIKIHYESPYGNPQSDDYIVAIKEMNKDTATIVVGLWGSEGTLMIFKKNVLGEWVYVRDIPDNDETEDETEDDNTQYQKNRDLLKQYGSQGKIPEMKFAVGTILKTVEDRLGPPDEDILERAGICHVKYGASYYQYQPYPNWPDDNPKLDSSVTPVTAISLTGSSKAFGIQLDTMNLNEVEDIFGKSKYGVSHAVTAGYFVRYEFANYYVDFCGAENGKVYGCKVGAYSFER